MYIRFWLGPTLEKTLSSKYFKKCFLTVKPFGETTLSGICRFGDEGPLLRELLGDENPLLRKLLREEGPLLRKLLSSRNK